MATSERVSEERVSHPTPTGKPPESDGADLGDESRKEDILAATLKLAADEGFDRISVRKVAALAGVSPSLVTYHFKTKARLLADAWWLLHARESRHRDETIGRVGALKRIDEGFRLQLDEPDSEVTPQLRLDFWSKTARTPALRDLFNKREKLLRKSHLLGLEASLEDGDLDPVLVDDLGVVEDLIQAFHLGIHTWLSLHVQPKDRARARQMARLFLARLKAPGLPKAEQ